MLETELLRYTRQILLDDWDIDAQLRLKTASVLMIGAGGLGCPVAQTLIRAGLGQLYIVDNDSIELSNLPRQSLFFDEHIGKAKSTTLANELQKHNPHCQITAINDYFDTALAATLITQHHFDLLIDCTDNFASRDVINHTSVTHQIPLLSGSAIGQTGQVALFERQTGCYHCLFDPDDSDDRRCADTGVLASTTAIIGNLQAQTALSYLGQGVNPIANTLLLWQGTTLSLKKLHFTKNPTCQTCGNPNFKTH